MRENPFSTNGVALLPPASSGLAPTVDTEAVRRARTRFVEYVERPRSSSSRQGIVLALVGDRGSGRTHLASVLFHEARNRLGRAHCAEGSKNGFTALVQDYLRRMGLAAVKELAHAYYRAAVVEAVRPFGAEVSALLEGVRWHPVDVVKRLALSESALVRGAQTQLHRAAGSERIGQALGLLLRPGFDDVVWRWLTGSPPDEVLADRGITDGLSTDVEALELLRVLVRLNADRFERFVLVLDDFDETLATPVAQHPELVPAVRAVLDEVVSGGGLLILCGTPSSFRLIPEDVRLRIGETIPIRPFTADEVRALVLAHQHELAPFTDQTLHYAHAITEGNARVVVRLCHEAIRLVGESVRATGSRTPLTEELLGSALRTSTGVPTAVHLAEVAQDLLAARGTAYSPHHRLRPDRAATADLWLTFSDRRGGCAVLFTETLIDQADLDSVRHRIAAVRAADPDAEVVVVAGRVTRRIGERLRHAIEQEPLGYREASFARDFLALVDMAGAHLLQRRSRDRDVLDDIAEGVVQLGRSQADISRFERKLDALLEAGSAVPGDEVLPSGAERLFRVVLDALDDSVRTAIPVQDAFGEQSARDRRLLASAVRDRGVLQAAGRAVVIRNAVLAFRQQVVEAYRTRDVELVKRSCEDYLDINDDLVAAELAPLFTGTGGTGDQRSVEDLLEKLAPSVEDEVVKAIHPPG